MSSASLTGDYSVFGYVKDLEGIWKHRFIDTLGIQPKTVSLGSAGYLFFYTSYGDVAETEQAIVVKLGFARSPNNGPVSSCTMLENRKIGPGFVDTEEVRGNALVACLGKKDPDLVAFKTILGVPQLYYYESNGEILCSDRLSCLVKLLGHVTLNDEIVPMHFLFRSIPGDLTYYCHIKRLLPGQTIRWRGGPVRNQSLLCFPEIKAPYSQKASSPSSLSILHAAIDRVISDYRQQAEVNGQSLATLLSGGVDSTLLQYFLNLHQQNISLPSFSYVIKSKDFQREVQYAQEARDLLHTDHKFIPVQPEDFLELLTRSVDILAQPPILETEPSMLSIAEYARENAVPYRYYLSGQGADTVFGLANSAKIKAIHMIGQIPNAAVTLKGLGKLLSPIDRLSKMLIKGALILSSAHEEDSFFAPANSIAVYGDMNLLRRCFGDQVLIKALRYRREFAQNYMKTDHYLEKYHLIDLMTDTYELGVQRQQIFLAHGKEQLHPFFDDDILRVAFSFPPEVRYIRGFRPKYLLKDLLTQKTNATISKRPKGFSIFEKNLYDWMTSGPLREVTENIELPGFLSRAEFNSLLKKPDYFLWILLNFDIFRRRCLT